MAYLRFSSEHDNRFYVYMSHSGLVWYGPDDFRLKDGDCADIETAKKLHDALSDYLDGNS